MLGTYPTVAQLAGLLRQSAVKIQNETEFQDVFERNAIRYKLSRDAVTDLVFYALNAVTVIERQEATEAAR